MCADVRRILLNIDLDKPHKLDVIAITVVADVLRSRVKFLSDIFILYYYYFVLLLFCIINLLGLSVVARVLKWAPFFFVFFLCRDM